MRAHVIIYVPTKKYVCIYIRTSALYFSYFHCCYCCFGIVTGHCCMSIWNFHLSVASFFHFRWGIFPWSPPSFLPSFHKPRNSLSLCSVIIPHASSESCKDLCTVELELSLGTHPKWNKLISYYINQICSTTVELYMYIHESNVVHM